MNDVVIRLAALPDLNPLCKLYVAFHEFHVRGVPGRLVSLGEPEAFDCTELLANLEKIIDGPDSVIFVAEIESELVGLAEVYLRRDDANSAQAACHYGYLQSLMVREPVRHHGIGTQLVAAAERWANSRGATEIRLDMWEFAEGPLHFYEKSGYRTLRRVMVREF
jgi:GNAT superfamily N-acetyltransferase